MSPQPERRNSLKDGKQDYSTQDGSQLHEVDLGSDVESATVILDQDDNDGIYAIVDAVVPRTDDPNMPVLTFRVWVLGIFWDLFMSFLSVFNLFRTTPITMSPFIGVLLSYPLGIGMSKILPRGILNPGPFNVKELSLIYIWASTGNTVAYAIYNIMGQKYLISQTYLPLWGCITFLLTTQCFGFGLAGICRRYLVRPASITWPSNFSTIALLHSFYQHNNNNDDDHESINSSSNYNNTTKPTMSRIKFFIIVFACMTVYQFIPSYAASVFGTIATLCYLAPLAGNSNILRVLGSGQQGVGLLSFSLDWSQFNTNSPLTTPLWAVLNQYFGAWFFMWILTPILWSTNAFGIDSKLGTNPKYGPNGTGQFPIGYALNTPAIFNRLGDPISGAMFVNRSTLLLNEQVYETHAPVYVTTLFAVEYFQAFVVFAAVFVHIGLWYGKDILKRFKSALNDLDKEDVHAQLMDVYEEVPEWWYIGTIVVFLVMGIISCKWGGFDLDWWGCGLAVLLAVVSIIPVGIIAGISGQVIGLNIISEFLIGFILPGRLVAVMSFKTFSFISMKQGLAMVKDLKLGHYMKIPPRAMFISQFISTVISGIFQLFVAFYLWESFGRDTDKLIDDENPSLGFQWNIVSKPLKGDLPGWKGTNFNTFLNAGAIWGAIGPARFFGPGSPYFATLWGFVIGAILPLIPYFLHKKFPKSIWHMVNIPVICVTTIDIGYNMAGLISPVIVAVIVNYFIKKYRPFWWKKYAYVMSAAFDAGAVVGTLAIYFLFHSNPSYMKPMPNWWLNPADQERCAPDYYLKCKGDENWGNAFGGRYDLAKNEYCSSIHFGSNR